MRTVSKKVLATLDPHPHYMMVSQNFWNSNFAGKLAVGISHFTTTLLLINLIVWIKYKQFGSSNPVKSRFHRLGRPRLAYFVGNLNWILPFHYIDYLYYFDRNGSRESITWAILLTRCQVTIRPSITLCTWWTSTPPSCQRTRSMTPSSSHSSASSYPPSTCRLSIQELMHWITRLAIGTIVT